MRIPGIGIFKKWAGDLIEDTTGSESDSLQVQSTQFHLHHLHHHPHSSRTVKTCFINPQDSS